MCFRRLALVRRVQMHEHIRSMPRQELAKLLNTWSERLVRLPQATEIEAGKWSKRCHSQRFCGWMRSWFFTRLISNKPPVSRMHQLILH